MSVNARMTYIGPYTDTTHEDDERNGKLCMLCMLFWTRTGDYNYSPPPNSGPPESRAPLGCPTHLHKVEKPARYR
jgi:hypothetical protein